MTVQGDEPQLILDSAKGDREAFRTLVERYQSRMLRLVSQVIRSREDAEDIVQESFVKAYLSLGSFRGQSSFYTWMYRIAFNLAIDWKRKAARRGGDKLELSDIETGKAVAAVDEAKIPSDDLFRKEQSALITNALDELSEDHRMVIVLREVDGLSYEEIAKITKASIGTVMSRLHYARKKLQVRLVEFKPSSSVDVTEGSSATASNLFSNAQTLQTKQAVYG